MLEPKDPETEQTPLSAEAYVRLGGIIVAVVFGGLFLWSVLAPIDGAVIASGQITVESNRKTVQHLEGGVVKEIFVREGQYVQEGDVLVRIDDTNVSANLALTDSQLAELYAQQARLLAERGDLEEMPKPSGVAAVLARDDFNENFKGQQELFMARRDTNRRQIALVEERITQQEERIQGLQAQQKSVNSQIRLIKDELEGVRVLNEKGFAPMTRVRALERERERLSGQIGSLQASLAESQSIIAEGRLEIERLSAVVREKAIEELRKISVSIAELEERRVAVSFAVERSEVRAPQSGEIIGLAIHTVGGVLQPGEAITDIVPRGDRLEVAARVAPRDVDKVRPGQEALVRFSAFSARRSLQATGTVRTVSADSLIDPVTHAAYYLVLIDLPEGEDLNSVLHGETLVPGMPAETFIKTGRQPAISYLLKPLTDALARSMRDV